MTWLSSSRPFLVKVWKSWNLLPTPGREEDELPILVNVAITAKNKITLLPVKFAAAVVVAAVVVVAVAAAVVAAVAVAAVTVAAVAVVVVPGAIGS